MVKRSVRTSPPAPAWIVVSGRADRECTVLDISHTGAKVVAQESQGIPDRFELAFFQSLDKRQRCEVIWRRGKVLGVKFVAEPVTPQLNS
jgi:PilZ domain-containing protein